MRAYLASSAFGRLYRKVDCSAADIAALRKAIYGRRLSIPLGLHNLEEIVLARAASPQARAAQLRQMLSLSSSRVLLKPCRQLLIDELRAFAAGAESPGPFARGALQNAVSSGISELLESDGEELNEEFAQALDQARREREAVCAGLGGFLEQCAGRFPQPDAAADFEEYYARHTPAALALLAERTAVGFDLRGRGGETPGALACVRMWVGAALALACAQSIHGRAAQAEDLNEAVHAMTGAAAADTFVAGDERALGWLGRVALDGRRAIGLKAFLAEAAESPQDR